MDRSMNNPDKFPGGPSPDYQLIETQNRVTSSGETAGSNSQRSAPKSTDKPFPEGVDVVPEHSVVSRQRDFASAQLTGKTSSDHASQPAHYPNDMEGKQPPARGSQLETSSGGTAAVATDLKPILHVKPASEASGHLSRGPSDAARLRPENLSATPKEPASGEAQRSASFASRRTNRSLATNGSAFANGAATTTNNPSDVDPSLQARAASAEDELSPRDKAVISKDENTVGRRLSKIIRNEAKSEKAALDVALAELAEIQKLQQASVKEEAEFHTRHARALSDTHKAEMKLLIARTANEREKAGLQAAGAELEASRKHARETTDMLRDKMQEVEWLRVHKGVDDREGAVKAKGLVGQRRRGLGKILRSA
ncbi:hypothetical protein EI94DRAFT_1795347 [Lactarius quietus]|nr:hypothetical protein EI94DRAFT_1795347 [Lactarius quietus]